MNKKEKRILREWINRETDFLNKTIKDCEHHKRNLEELDKKHVKTKR